MEQLKNNFENQGEEGKSAKDKLNDIETKRTDAINSLLHMLEEKLDSIYMMLTKKDAVIYGRAHLVVEDKIAPFKSTINYVPNPPGKRSVYDIHQLSSGEKSMAVLAFLFTIVKYWNLPFLILDESDAHLDDIHISKITEYICKYLKKQCVFVSHKEKTIGKISKTQEKLTLFYRISRFISRSHI